MPTDEFNSLKDKLDEGYNIMYIKDNIEADVLYFSELEIFLCYNSEEFTLTIDEDYKHFVIKE